MHTLDLATVGKTINVLSKQWAFYYALPVTDTRTDSLHALDSVIHGLAQEYHPDSELLFNDFINACKGNTNE